MDLKALVVDDEPFARADLRQLIGDSAGIRVLWEAASLDEARRVLAMDQPDVVFLDVQLTDGCGFDLMPHLAEATQVIFVTAYDQYALRAFEVNALDYLLKPVSGERFRSCLARLMIPYASGLTNFPSTQVDLEDRILIKSGSSREFVKVDDLVAVTSLGGNYTQVCKAGGCWLDVRRTLKEWETILPKTSFVRIHRATMVNLLHIARLARHPGGRIQLRINHIPDPVIVSRRHAHRLEAGIADRQAPPSSACASK